MERYFVYLISFIVTIAILGMIAFLITRSSVNISQELLGAMVGYLFGELRHALSAVLPPVKQDTANLSIKPESVIVEPPKK